MINTETMFFKPFMKILILLSNLLFNRKFKIIKKLNLNFKITNMENLFMSFYVKISRYKIYRLIL